MDDSHTFSYAGSAEDYQVAMGPDPADQLSSTYPVISAASAGLPSPAATIGGLAGATVNATLYFEPGSFDNLFDCGNYFVPAGFRNSYPHPPSGIVVTDTAGPGSVEFGYTDDMSSLSVDLSTTGMITISSTVKEPGMDVYKAVVKVSSDAFSMPQYGGVVKVSDTFTSGVTARLQAGVLVLEAAAAHIDSAGTFTAVFQLVVSDPDLPTAWDCAGSTMLKQLHALSILHC